MDDDGAVIILTSNGSMDRYPDNKLSDFTIELPTQLGTVKRMAMTQISYPQNWHNLANPVTLLYGPLAKVQRERSFKNFNRHTIPAGYYHSVRALLKETNRLSRVFQHPYTSDPRGSQPLFSADDNHVTVTLPGGRILVGPTLFFVQLGFPVSVEERADTIMIANSESYKRGDLSNFGFSPLGDRFFLSPDVAVGLTDRGLEEVDINVGCSHLFVKCDSVANSILAHTLEPLLDVVPVLNERKRLMASYSLIDPVYRQVVRNPLTTIRISIVNDLGLPFPFGDTGRVVVKLKLI